MAPVDFTWSPQQQKGTPVPELVLGLGHEVILAEEGPWSGQDVTDKGPQTPTQATKHQICCQPRMFSLLGSGFGMLKSRVPSSSASSHKRNCCKMRGAISRGVKELGPAGDGVQAAVQVRAEQPQRSPGQRRQEPAVRKLLF